MYIFNYLEGNIHKPNINNKITHFQKKNCNKYNLLKIYKNMASEPNFMNI